MCHVLTITTSSGASVEITSTERMYGLVLTLLGRRELINQVDKGKAALSWGSAKTPVKLMVEVHSVQGEEQEQ